MDVSYYYFFKLFYIIQKPGKLVFVCSFGKMKMKHELYVLEMKKKVLNVATSNLEF